MGSVIHDAIAAVAKDRGAMAISEAVLSAVALRAIKTAHAFGSSAKAQVPTGNELVAGRLSKLSITDKDLRASIVSKGGGLGVEVRPGFDAFIELVVPGTDSLYSTVRISVPSLIFPLRAADKMISFGETTVPIEAQVVEAPTRGQAVAESMIDLNELLRVEASIAYAGAGSRLIASALGKLDPIDLAGIFPAFDFGGSLELFNVETNLVVVPEWLTFADSGCPKGNATDGLKVIPQTPVDSDRGSEEFRRTWPIYVQLPEKKEFLRPVSSVGLVAAYLPKRLIDEKFSKVPPAVTHRERDNGFIGYDVRLSAQIKRVSASIDSQELALRARLEFSSWGDGEATVDVPCVGRVELAEINLDLPKNYGTAYVEAAMRLAVDGAGRLVMRSELSEAQLGEAEVRVELVGKYITFAGGTAVQGFIADAILGKVIANNLPWIVFDAIEAAVNQYFFVLADISTLRGYLDLLPTAATWSDANDSVLLGLGLVPQLS